MLLILVKMIRKTLFKTIAVGEGMELNSRHSRDEQGFRAEKWSEGVSGWKSLKEMSTAGTLADLAYQDSHSSQPDDLDQVG